MAAPTALVWLKRDLRLADHAPLAEAARFERALAVVVVEPAWLQSPEFDAQHLAFALATLAPLRDALWARGLPLLVVHGDAVTALDTIARRHGVTHLFSHEETGPWWSWDRDRAVAAWARERGIAWTEWPHSGVVRRLRSRNGWARRWERRMAEPSSGVPDGWAGIAGLRPSPLPTLADLGVQPSIRPLPEAGETAARARLQAFVGGGARGYTKAISSPLTAERGCSRLSAHLAFGALSMRQVHQATEAAKDCALGRGDRSLARGLHGFGARLRWHCHFMQKLEDEPEVEHRNFARACDGLRESDFDRARFEAWCDGCTGYPMVDACMRSLRATGWLNFRMRAMLVSFAAYHLWLHWREPGLFLARQFLDFEPGIHWSQMQMQSGTTGINTLRIYSPAKQQREHDPDGRFVRRWLPEFGTGDYPPPIVDEAPALAAAKQRLYALRRGNAAREEADAIQRRHGSRKAGLPASGGRRRAPKSDPAQRELFP